MTDTLKALHEAATEAPWDTSVPGRFVLDGWGNIVADCTDSSRPEADAALIVALCNGIADGTLMTAYEWQQRFRCEQKGSVRDE